MRVALMIQYSRLGKAKTLFLRSMAATILETAAGQSKARGIAIVFPSVIGVLTNPGHMVVSAMALPASSIRKPSINALTADLLAQ